MDARVWHAMILASSLALAGGCGGDDSDDDGGGAGNGSSGNGSPGGGSGQVDSGLDSGSELSALSEADAMQLCERTVAAAEATFSDELLQELACTFQGGLFSFEVDNEGNVDFDVAMCEAEYSMCLEIPGESTSSNDCDSGTLQSDLESCGATVEQYESCVNAALEAIGQALDSITCESLADPGSIDLLIDDPTSLDSIEECDELQAQCPSLDPLGTGVSSSGEPSESGCEDTCAFAGDDECDDGGPDALTSACALGTDCMDCGER